MIQVASIDRISARKLKREFRIIANNRVLIPTWNTRAPAEAAADLLRRGLGKVTDSGGIQWLDASEESTIPVQTSEVTHP